MDKSLKISVPTVLIPFTLSPRAGSVISEGQKIASVLSAKVYFLHVGEDTLEVRQKIKKIFKEINPDSDEASLMIRFGPTDQVICSTAKEIRVALIIAGALEHEGIWVGILGSIARRIARNAPCSVLLLTRPMMTSHSLETVCASIQYDDKSTELIKFILSFDQLIPIRHLYIIYECEMEIRFGSIDMGDQHHAQRYAHQWKSKEKERLDQFVKDFNFQTISVKGVCLEGRPGVQAAEYARLHDVDLLIMPAPEKPLTFLDRFFHHPTEVALQDLPCSVLIFRQPQKMNLTATR